MFLFHSADCRPEGDESGVGGEMPQIRADEHPKVNLRGAGTAAAVPFLSLPYLGKLMCERGQRYGNEEKEGGNRKQLVLVRAQ